MEVPTPKEVDDMGELVFTSKELSDWLREEDGCERPEGQAVQED